MRRIAVMQPYLFPYLGYFQLINAVDKFVIYDDVSYIRQGWINRNRILLNGREHMFTVQVAGASSFKKINDTEISSTSYDQWKNKFYKTLEVAYKKAPYFDPVYPIVKEVFDTDERQIGKLASRSIETVCHYLQVPTEFQWSSSHYDNVGLKAQERVIDICKKEYASEYLNMKGGSSLYSKDTFGKEGIKLSFLLPEPVPYRQFANPFVPGLSIIDVMMFNSKDEVLTLLRQYQLV